MIPRRRQGKIVLLCLAVVVVLVVLAVAAFLARPTAAVPLAEGDLGDGRILQVEGISFGTNHQAGVGSPMLRKFGAWMPAKLREFLEPKVPRSTITRSEPALVVWVTALHPTFRTNVDCQGIRVEFVDESGTVYGDNQPNWFGAERFWRVGHVFKAFPREAKTLKMRVTPWRGTNAIAFTLPNPGYTTGTDWQGEWPPLKRRDGGHEMVLKDLIATTNKGTYWKAANVFWKPEFEIWTQGKREESGWDLEWMAEDAYGNRGQELGVTKPVLKFTATFHPSGTNMGRAVLITNLPITVMGSNSNEWWNLAAMVTTNRVEILGLFPAGVHTFSEGEYLTNAPTKFGPVRGGAPTGWVSSSRETPLRKQSFHGHYSNVPVIYVRVADPKSTQRIAMRVRDVETGAYHLAAPEPQGSASRIVPFLVSTPPEVQRIEADLVLLPPLSAEFLVDTRER